MDLTKREFLRHTAKCFLATAVGGSTLTSCTYGDLQRKDLGDILSPDHYAQLTRDWDPVYGPSIQGYSKYGGPGDYMGHIRGGATPGIDYDVPNGTPLVPSTLSCLRQIQRDDNGALYVLLMDLFHPTYFTYLGHIGDVLVDETFLVAGEVGRYLREGVRALGRNEIIALSGNSGWGPKEYGWRQPAHLHYSLYCFDKEKRTLENLNPDLYGLDGGRSVLWDGRTRLDVRAEERLSYLEETLSGFERELDLWPATPGVEELKGNLMEHYRFLEDVRGNDILGSGHFQDLRALLKRMILEEKKYLPGSAPYAMMLKIVGYSTSQKQKVILTLPFIPPGLEKSYQKPVYENGPFFNLSAVKT